MRMSRAAGLVLLVAGCQSPPPIPWPALARETQSSGTTALLQAVSAVNDSVVWVSGQRGTWARTLNAGLTWRVGGVPGGDTLQFRDVHAQSGDTAWLLSSGNGELSRIYRTTDGGASWTLQFQNADSAAFYDCMDFWDGRRGLVYGDEVNGRLMILETTDGEHWSLIPKERLPAALPGEGGFAASGTCLVTAPGGYAWIGTGNGPKSRVLRTTDYGQTWKVSEAPIAAGEAAGIATVAFSDARVGAVLGGPIGSPDAVTDNVAITRDGGATWDSAGRPTFAGAVYGAAFVPGTHTLVAVGPKGASISNDAGRHWASLDTLNFWGLGFSPGGAGWLVGTRGRVVHLRR
jgi:photosystem II stability/assembly factor-like uncharacterized protein